MVEVVTVIDPSLRDEFIAFLRSDPTHPIDFQDLDECALARFGQSRHPGCEVIGGAWSYGVTFPNGKYTSYIVTQCGAETWHRYNTYGEAADSLESVPWMIRWWKRIIAALASR